MRERELVPVSELIDLEGLERTTKRTDHPPTAREIRAALPRGWALAEDGCHAYRDHRLFYREAWILIAGLVVFGSVGGAFLWGAMPAGWSGLFRMGILIGAVLLIGGVVAPRITRALMKR